MDALESIREMYGEIDPDEQIESLESRKLGHRGSTASPPPTMEPSHPSLEDSVGPPPHMDAMESMWEIDPEEIKPSKRLKSSEWMNPGHHISTPSSPPTMELSETSQVDSMGFPPLMDAIQSVRKMYDKTDPVEQIDPLFSFVQTQLQKMNNPSERGSSSSEGWLETVPDSTKQLAAKTIDTISTEAEKLAKSNAVEAITLKVVKGFGELHLVLIGLSVAVFALQSYMEVSSTENECRALLLKILDLTQHTKQYREQMHERGKLCNAVGTIVEGAVICCDYLRRGRIFRHRTFCKMAHEHLPHYRSSDHDDSKRQPLCKNRKGAGPFEHLSSILSNCLLQTNGVCKCEEE